MYISNQNENFNNGSQEWPGNNRFKIHFERMKIREDCQVSKKRQK